MKKSLIGSAAVAAAIAVAGCGSSSGSASSAKSYSAPAPTQGAASASASHGVTIAHGKDGSYVADVKGRALYLFEADKGTMSSCYSACASVWPPLVSAAPVRAGTGVTRGLLGTTKRTDGKTEVTYHGHPLYYYAGDSAPGATTGQGVNQFGAKWYLVRPNGNKLDNDEH